MKTRGYIVVVIALVVGLIVGAFAVLPGQIAEASNQKYEFFVVSHSTPHAFWDAVRNGAKDAAKLVNVELTYPFMETYDISKEVEFFRMAFAAKVDGILVTTPEPGPIRPFVKEAMDKGIPVVCMNTDDPTGKTPYMSYIGANLYHQGYLVGKRFATLLSPGDRGVTIITEPGHVGLEARAKGIKDALAEVGIETDKLDVGPDMTKAFELIKSYVAAHPDTKFISGTGGRCTHFTGLYIKTEGLKDKVIGGGFDVSEPVLNLIKEGYLAFSSDQQPYAQGFYGIIQLYVYKTAGIFPMDMETAVGFIDATNVDEEMEFAKKGYRG